MRLRRPKIERLFLGSVGIVPRSEFASIEQLGLAPSIDPEPTLEKEIREIFALRPLAEADDPGTNDYGIDVLVASFRTGAALGAHLASLTVPVFWRPRVELKARVFSLSSGKTVATAAATSRMGYRAFARRLLKPAAILSLRPAVSAEDLVQLTREASFALLAQVKRKTR